MKLAKRTWCRHFALHTPVGWRCRPLAMAAAAWHHSWSRPHSLQTQAAAFVLTHRARFAASSAALCGNCTRAHIPQRRSRCRRRDACGHSVRSRHQLKVANDSGLLTTGPLAGSMPDEVRGGHHERRRGQSHHGMQQQRQCARCRWSKKRQQHEHVCGWRSDVFLWLLSRSALIN